MKFREINLNAIYKYEIKYVTFIYSLLIYGLTFLKNKDYWVAEIFLKTVKTT